jgi:hypothetical protein
MANGVRSFSFADRSKIEKICMDKTVATLTQQMKSDQGEDQRQGGRTVVADTE